MSGKLGRGKDVVDIIFLERIGGRDGEARPNDRGWIERRDEQGEFVGGNMVG